MTDPSLSSASGTLNLAYRLAEQDAAGETVYGPWTSFPIVLAAASAIATIADVKLANVTGPTMPLPETTDSQIAGNLSGVAPGTSPQVQIYYGDDYQSAGPPDELVTPAADGSFSDSLPGLPFGPVTLHLRVAQSDATGNSVYSGFTTFSFVYEQAQAPAIKSLTLADDTESPLPLGEGQGEGGSYQAGLPTSSDPTVTGQVEMPAGAQPLRVELSFNGGLLHGVATTDAQGNFTYTPQGLPFGTVTVSASATIDEPQAGLIDGPASSLSFNYVAPSPSQASVVSLQLANTSAIEQPGQGGSISSTPTTSDPTVSGQIVFPTQSPPQGSGFGVQGLGTGTTTSAGIGSGNGLVASGMIGLGATDAGSLTTSATGNLKATMSTDFQTVQFQVNGADAGSTTTGVGGTFQFKPSGLTPGETVQLSARAVVYDPVSQANITGPWAAYTFVYQPAASQTVTVSQLSLVSPLPSGVQGEGGSNQSTLPIASDPTIQGQLSVAGGQSPANNAQLATSQTAFLTVQVDTNDDGVPDASVVADAHGDFTFTPTNLSYGTVTVEARARVHDTTSQSFTYGPWTSLTYTYEAPASTPVPTLDSFGLAADTGDQSGSGLSGIVSGNPAVMGHVQGSGFGVQGSGFRVQGRRSRQATQGVPRFRRQALL